jgi:hypothetical protein
MDALAAVDQTLRETLRGLPEPRLSPFFDGRFEARLGRERLRLRSLRRLRRALQLYWLSAVVASALIVLRLPMATQTLADSPVLLATLAGGAILPGVLLLIALGKDPVELVFETLDWLA